MQSAKLTRTKRLHNAIGLDDFDLAESLLRQGNVDVNWAPEKADLVKGNWEIGKPLRRDERSVRLLPGPTSLMLAAHLL